MRRSIIVVDGFYSDPHRVIKYARSLEFVTPYNRDARANDSASVAWRASRFRDARQCPFKSSNLLIGRLEHIVGESIDRESWDRGFPLDNRGYPIARFQSVPRSAWWNCAFHVKHSKTRIGEGVHSHTDRDNWNAVGEQGWVGLVYLNEDADRQSGLRTWQNVDPARRYDWMTAKENWILCDTLANVFNRLILHRGDIPHSGSAGWGNSLQDGRFYQTFFFRTTATDSIPEVSSQDLCLDIHEHQPRI